MGRDPRRETWDELWRSTEDDSSKLYLLHDRMMKVLTDAVDVRGKKVLEVGAGRGADSAHLNRLGARVTVLDFSSESCKRMHKTAEKLGVELDVVEGDATTMPFPAESFDIVFHQGFLEHFENPEAILGEQFRILKPGGFVLIDVPQKFTLYTVRKKVAIMRNRWFGGWETQFSIRELEKLVESCGFRVRRSYGWGVTNSFGFFKKPAVRRLWLRTAGRLSRGQSPVNSGNGGEPDVEAPITGTMGKRRILLWFVDNVGVLAQKHL